jgi:ribosomal protein S27AE
MMETSNQCPRCGGGRLRSWDKLTDEEREVVKRLPASADYSLDERQARHRWCARCWYEDTGQSSTLA